jgi:hypothetical protein
MLSSSETPALISAAAVASSFKGTAANFGASRMQTLASAIEMKGRAGPLEGASDVFVRLQAEHQRVRTAVEGAR